MKNGKPRRRDRLADLNLLKPMVRPLWKLGAAALALSFAANALGCLLPVSGKIVTDFLLLNSGFEAIDRAFRFLGMEQGSPWLKAVFSSPLMVFSGILLVGLGTIILAFFQQFLVFRFQQRLAFQVKTALFERMLRFPFGFFAKTSGGYLSTRISNDIEACQLVFSLGFSQVISQIFRVFCGTFVLFTLNGRLTLMFLIVIPFYGLLNRFFVRRIRRTSWREKELEARVGEDIQEAFAGIETVKAFGIETLQSEKVSNRNRMAIEAREKEAGLALFSHAVGRALQGVTGLVILAFGILEVGHGRMTVGDLVGFCACMGLLSVSLGDLALFQVDFQPLLVSLFRVLLLLKRFPEADEPDAGESAGRSDPAPLGEWFLQNICFSYKDGNPVLKDFSACVERGRITAVIAPSGTGKTTLAKLLLRFFSPQAGQIFLNGIPIENMDLYRYRRMIGYVSQDIFLFRDTIAANLRVAKADASLKEIKCACEKAGIHADIARLPQGYETMVGERGMTLSLGQRQRLAIARALLKNPPLFLLDEPTSALDPETEEAVLASIREPLKMGTTILISHKASIQSYADRVISLPLVPGSAA